MMTAFRRSAAALLGGTMLAATVFAGAGAHAQTSEIAVRANAPVTRMIVFGDSLADGGFFLTLDPRIPRDAGSFTTNPDPVAPEVTAARLGIDLRPVYGQGGTNYAVGGARVSAINGPSIPITNQITNFLASGGTFGPRDLVYIQGGGNDYFAFLAGGGRDPAILTTAATQLAGQVRRLQDAGATRIVTLAVQSGGAAPLQSFNQTFAAALATNGVNALYFDTDRLFNEIVANAASFGITNTTTGVACTVPSSLNCNRSMLVRPDANETFLLADSVHPAGVTQRIQGQAIASLLEAPEQMAGLAYAAQASFRSHRGLFEGPMRGGSMRDDAALSLFGAVAYHYHDADTRVQRVGLNERGVTGMLGVDLKLGEASGIGIVGGYGEGEGEFGRQAGTYDSRTLTGSAYARAEFGPVRVFADGTYGKIDYEDLTRTFQLGRTQRGNISETDGDYYAARATAAVDLFRGAGLGFGPDVAVQYERLDLDAFTEGTALSTNAAFGEQRLRSLTGRFGAVARSLPGSRARFFARASYEREFDDDPRTISITPTGAPISFTSGVERADRNYMSYAFSVDGQIASGLAGGLSLRAGVTGEALREDRDSVTAFAGLSLAL